jgi:hypothetical protein
MPRTRPIMGRILSKTEQRQRFTRCRNHASVARSRRPGEYSRFVNSDGIHPERFREGPALLTLFLGWLERALL